MKDDHFTILASLILGLLELTFRFGYDMMAFTVESIMYSVKGRCPHCIIDFAGYYGQCVYYVFYTISCLIGPAILHSIGIRKTLIVSVLCFWAYITSFLYIRNFIYFPAAAVAGFGCALFYLGTATYSAKHSTASTFSRNQAIYWTVARTGFIIVGLILVSVCGLMMILTNHLNDRSSSSPNVTLSETYRYYSEFELTLMTFGSMAVQLLSLLIAIFLPMRKIAASLFTQREIASTKEQLANIFMMIFKWDFLLLAPLHIFAGMHVAFLLTVYPTTILFTGDFAENRNLVGYICISMAIGEIAIGSLISLTSRRFKDSSVWPIFWMTLASFVISVMLLVLFTPPMSSIHPTNGEAILGTSIPVALVMGGLNGVIDGCQSNVRMVISARVLPSNPAIAFSISRFWQAGASAMFFLISTLFTVYQLAALLTFTMFLATIGFSLLMRRLKAREAKE